MKPRRSAVTVSIFTVVAFLIIEGLPFVAPRDPSFAILGYTIPKAAMLTIRKLVWVALCVIAVMLSQRCGFKCALRELGLLAPVRPALAVAVVASAPMLLLAAVSPLNPQLNAWDLVQAAIGSGVGEEVLFRGYLFAQLYRHARWPFWAAGLISALPFAIRHLYQHTETGLALFAGLAEVVLIIWLSSIFAAWLFVRWNDNLVVLIGFHGLGNLWWYLWGEGQEQIYGRLGDVLRVATIVMAISVTLLRTRRAGNTLATK